MSFFTGGAFCGAGLAGPVSKRGFSGFISYQANTSSVVIDLVEDGPSWLDLLSTWLEEHYVC